MAARLVPSHCVGLLCVQPALQALLAQSTVVTCLGLGICPVLRGQGWQGTQSQGELLHQAKQSQVEPPCPFLPLVLFFKARAVVAWGFVFHSTTPDSSWVWNAGLWHGAETPAESGLL